MKRVAIIGGGGWGTALSIALSGMGHPIRLWVYEPELVPAINEERCNPLYLSGFSVPEPVVATGSLGFGLEGAEIVVTALPANCCRRIYQEMLPYLCPEAILVSATKGLESASLQRMSEVMEAVVLAPFSAADGRDLRSHLRQGGGSGRSDGHCGGRSRSNRQPGRTNRILRSLASFLYQYRYHRR